MPQNPLSFSFPILCYQQYEQCSSSSSSGTTTHCEPWLPIRSSSSPSGLWPLFVNFFVLSSNYLQPRRPYFLWSSSFTCSFHCHHFWHSFVIRPLQYVHVILIYAILQISRSFCTSTFLQENYILFLFSLFFLSLSLSLFFFGGGEQNISYKRPFEYSKSIHNF